MRGTGYILVSDVVGQADLHADGHRLELSHALSGR